MLQKGNILFVKRVQKSEKKLLSAFPSMKKVTAIRRQLTGNSNLKLKSKMWASYFQLSIKKLNLQTQNFIKIIDAIQYLAREGIPLRADGEEKDSNLCQLLAFKTKNDPELKEWLQQKINTWLLFFKMNFCK